MKKLLALALSAATLAGLSVSPFAASTPTVPNLDAGTDFVKENGVQVLTEEGNEKLIYGLTGGYDVIPLTTVAVDEDGVPVNDGDTVKSDEDFYATLPVLAVNEIFNDKDYFKIKFDKDDPDKCIMYAFPVETRLEETSNPLYQNRRVVAFRFILNPKMDDGEYKFGGTLTFTAKEDIAIDVSTAGRFGTASFEPAESCSDLTAPSIYVLPKGMKIDLEISGWSKNTKLEGDQDLIAGDGGQVVKPTKNEENTVTWEGDSDTLATLTMDVDDDSKVYYPKLSTKWYAQLPFTQLFADQDAYIFNFMGTPTLSSTSRAKLEINNPFVDKDGEFQVNPEDVVIYSVVDGQLKDVTSSFKAGENENGESVFVLRTRQLGIYVLAEKPLAVPASQSAE